MDGNAFSLRCDVEFAFAEGCLQLGPHYMHATMLCSDSVGAALLNLYHDYTIHDWDMETVGRGEVMPYITQGPERDPASDKRSLWTGLLERLSLLIPCPLQQVQRRIQVQCDVPAHDLAWMGLYGKEKLLQGLDIRSAVR